jgi:hypothetical protein
MLRQAKPIGTYVLLTAAGTGAAKKVVRRWIHQPPPEPHGRQFVFGSQTPDEFQQALVCRDHGCALPLCRDPSFLLRMGFHRVQQIPGAHQRQKLRRGPALENDPAMSQMPAANNTTTIHAAADSNMLTAFLRARLTPCPEQ